LTFTEKFLGCFFHRIKSNLEKEVFLKCLLKLNRIDTILMLDFSANAVGKSVAMVMATISTACDFKFGFLLARNFSLHKIAAALPSEVGLNSGIIDWKLC